MYTTRSYKLDKLETKVKKKAIIQGMIEARQEKYIIYVDAIDRRMLTATEAEEQKMDSAEYSLAGRIEIYPNGKVVDMTD